MNGDSVLLLGLGAVVVYLLSQQQTAQTVQTSSGNTAVTVTPPQTIVREVVTRVPVARSYVPVMRQPPASTLPPVVRPPVVRGRAVAL